MFDQKMFGWFSESMAKQRGCVTWVDANGNDVQVTTVVPEKYNGHTYPASKFGDEVFLGPLRDYKEGEMRSDIGTYIPPDKKSKGKKKFVKRKR